MFKQTALAALITIALCIPAEAKILIGDVVSVTDGDTVTVRVDGEDISIRIRGIDAPELEQEYGEEAKAALTGFLLKHQAIISGEEKDAAGRLLASLAVNGNDAGLYMLKTAVLGSGLTTNLSSPPTGARLTEPHSPKPRARVSAYGLPCVRFRRGAGASSSAKPHSSKKKSGAKAWKALRRNSSRTSTFSKTTGAM
ncbi:MAG: thermonuclease family protein [Sutterella sp.]|nr:thermonuclease family protein [Sutterella sp.]